MRILVLALGLAGAGPVAASSAPADPQVLERAWHACLREASAHQPPGQSRAGDERNALDECRAREDAYVAALMAAAPVGPDAPPTGWARAWAAVVDPLAAWIDALRR